MPNVRDLTVTPKSRDTVILEFKPPKNQRLNNLTAIIRHSEKTGGTVKFANTTRIKEVPVTDTSVQVPRLRGTYLIKLRDDVTKKRKAILRSPLSCPFQTQNKNSKFLMPVKMSTSQPKEHSHVN